MASLLSQINYPEDLRKEDKKHLTQLCGELRQFIIDVVSRHGGHFGASLGVVELSCALHYVFNTPEDLLVWDVGHQAYGHKILTGRRTQFITNRKYGGLSGFPKISESPYDAFGVGHASTSVSAALGMAMAASYQKKDKQVVAVIGDGALTGGMAFEALNHAGATQENMLIILNDNCMSIDPNVGALKEYLTAITTSQIYNKIKKEAWHLLNKMPIGRKTLLDIARKMDTGLKGLITQQSNLFEALNIRYFGPIDGHNVLNLVEVLDHLKSIKGVKLLHVLTTKGKGFEPAEKKQTLWHAPGLFDKDTGIIYPSDKKDERQRYQDVFGHTLLELAQANDRIFGITPAMPSGSSLNIMIAAMPERAIDVGICEQHAVTLSAGMATQGLKVFCNIYSTFMQRAYDQIIHDVALQKLPVIFCLDRAGLVGEDGPTHHGVFDMAYLRCIPNLIVAAPLNEHELRHMMYTAQLEQTRLPFCIRYPRGKGVLADWRNTLEEMPIGKGQCIEKGAGDVAVLTLGPIGNSIIAINKTRKENNLPLVAHYNMRFVKPLDEELLHHICQSYPKLISVEDGCKKGGFGSAVAEFIIEHQYKNNLTITGIPDRFIEHGSIQELYRECGLDEQSLARQIAHQFKEQGYVAAVQTGV